LREILRRMLVWLGLTGKLVLHSAWILVLSLGILVGLTWYRARTVIRNELRKTEVVRVEQWAIRNAAAIRDADAWKIADALVSMGHDPYVVYAGFFDRSGKPIAHQGDEQAYLRPHRLELLIPIKSSGETGEALEPSPPPLPGLVADTREAARAVPLGERIRLALEGAENTGEDLRGWIEVTLATEPLDAILWRVVTQLAVVSSVLLVLGVLLTWALVRQIVVPIRILKRHAEWISEGRLDEPFHLVPRPPDEVGDLATTFSVMASILKSRREELDAQILERTRALQAARLLSGSAEIQEGDAARRLVKLVHDLKSPLTSIHAFSEILLDEDPVAGGDPGERRRFLESIRSESERLAAMLDGLLREPAGSPDGEGGEGVDPGDPVWDDAIAAAVAAEAADDGNPETHAAGALRRVLVATGDDPLRELIRDAFASDGTEVVEAADAISTLRLARETLPDGVVLDLLMDGGEALTVLGDLRGDRRTSGIPVLPMSVVRDGDRLRAGAVSFQPKPLDRDRFLGAVRSALAADLAGPARILVVDDDRYVAEAVGAFLSREGMEVQIVSGGEEALLAARVDRPDLIVLDMKMPGLDGVDVIRRLRASPESTDRPVILMTAHDIPRADQSGWPGVTLSRESFLKGVRSALREAALR